MVTKENLRSKISLLYDKLFDSKTIGNAKADFWHELFLLTPNANEFTKHLTNIPQDNLHGLQDLFYLLLTKCFDGMASRNQFMQLNSCQTAEMTFRFVFSFKWNNFTSDVLGCICGLERADSLFKLMLQSITKLLEQKDLKQTVHSDAIVSCLQLLWTIITATETLNINGVLSFLVQGKLFHPILQVIQNHSHDKSNSIPEFSLIILSMLSNYRNSRNQILAGIIEVHDENIFCQWMEVLQKPGESPVIANNSGMFSYLYSLVSPPTSPSTTRYSTVTLSNEKLLALHTLLLHNAKFRSYWCRNTGLKSLIPLFMEQFTTGDLLLCRVCLHFLWIITPNISPNEKIEWTEQDILVTNTYSPYQKQILYEFDARAPVLSLLIIYIALNQRKTHANLIMQALAMILKQLKIAKQEKFRTDFNWESLYRHLIFTIKMFSDNKELVEKALSILDYILCFGDNFLCDTQSYDKLFYQLILNHEMFTQDGNFMDCEHCKNLRGICQGFLKKYADNLDSPDTVIKNIHKYYEEVELDLKAKYEISLTLDIDGFISGILRSPRRFVCIQ